MSDPSTPDSSGFPSFADQPSPPMSPATGQPPPPTGPPAPTQHPVPSMMAPVGPPGFADGAHQHPRPRSPIGAGLMMLGGLMAIIGSFLPWATQGSQSINGFDNWVWIDGFELYSIDSPANLAVVGALLMLGLGIATLAAGRVLAVAIIATVAAVIGIAGGMLLFAIPAAIVDIDEGSVAIGAFLQPVAPVVSLVGSIVVLAKKRTSPV